LLIHFWRRRRNEQCVEGKVRKWWN
jgi:hypothetical protein